MIIITEETNKETGLLDLASLSKKVFHMHLCDDQVFLEQCRFQERKETCTPFPADCLICLIFVKVILI